MSLNDANRSRIRASMAALAKMPARLDAPMGQLFSEVADKARQLAPRETGELAESIKVYEPPAFSSGNARRPRSWSVVVESDHAAAEEYGTSHQLPHPFFRPATRPAAAKAKAIVLRTVADSILDAR